MKPPQMAGESSWGHEVKQATMALVGSLTQKLRENSRAGAGACRRSVNSEDPMRRLMFLGPWSHT
ncbi:hypothetical protein MUK42_14051 [Musa troglodytarum]|uniref:Uncharacterized protein n=1 Tax=Musa troglodytarum TaxID=320322 RepID=A0A9E7HUR5_9LILI|nr:hypothetical protein MUK42_14051 [Musa troglodytarum]